MKCGNCTMCCKFPKIVETKSKAGEYCKYCEPKVGCKIYSERPESCKIFECAWKQMEHAGEELRPDRCNVLFEKWSDYLIVGATDTELSKLVLAQIDFFRGEGISVLIIDHSKKSKTVFLAPGHTRQFVKEQINGSTKLHRRLN